MNAALGHTGVLLGLAAAVTGVVVIAVGLARRRPQAHGGAVYAALALVGAVLATVAMERAFLTHDFSVAYVAANNSRSTPLLYTVTGMWSALAGSILLWGLILAGYIAAMVWRFRRHAADPLVAWATLVTLVVAAFFFGLMAGPADPFRTVAGPAPASGLGPNVLLQDNALVAFHPPVLYLGLVGFTIPFAFAVASLVTGRVGEGWQVATRRWTLVAWGFLTVGIVLGAWWSYQVLGWGGFWAWDPVENASLLPWLCATAYLHSVLVQERRGLLRVWNLSLVVATFSLTVLATFLTRSGVIQSVHAFSDSDIGPLLLGFFGAVVATGVGLIAWRGDRLRSPGGIDAAVSREGAFLLNNLLFVVFAFVVLLGTVFPLLYEAFRGQQVTVGAPYFDAMTLPIGLALLFLMAVGPALPWRKAAPRTLRTRLVIPAWAGALVVVACVAVGVRGVVPLAAFGLGAFAFAANVRQLVLAAHGAHRRGAGAWRGLVGRANGGMVVHLGVVVIAVALAAATSFGHRGEVTLHRGAAAVSDGHRIAFTGLAHVRTPARTATEALVFVDGRGPLRPAVSQFGSDSSAVGTPAIDSSWRDDVYLTIDALPTTASGAVTIGVTVQPLVSWLWAGGVLLVIGAALAAVPGRRRRPTDPASAPGPPGRTRPSRATRRRRARAAGRADPHHLSPDRDDERPSRRLAPSANADKQSEVHRREADVSVRAGSP
ncbi:MAG TPA: heme lyase CcmF/NrfE family subunit [Acidimicrobiales bacterium]|nr:heme lyase CcmF/NrfE family subunit [Acidimicrobiales bacterium]